MSDAELNKARADALPDDDIIAVLQRQHASIRDVMARVENTAGQARLQSFAQLRSLITSHERAEEELVHPVTRESGGKSVAKAREKEERQADRLLGSLDGVDVDTTDFRDRFAAFRHAVEGHADAEEHEEFSVLRAALSQEERIDLGHKFSASVGATG